LLDILRVLLPSWRFFDDVSGSPTLLIRCGATGGELGPWQTLSLAGPSSLAHRGSRSEHKAGSVFLRARGNLALAHHTLLEHLLSDVAELDERLDPDAAADAIPQLVSYRLVMRLARARLDADRSPLAREPEAAAPRRRFQFKLTVPPDAERHTPRAPQAHQGPGAEDLLISRLHDA
jgi:hypothetical protein